MKLMILKHFLEVILNANSIFYNKPELILPSHCLVCVALTWFKDIAQMHSTPSVIVDIFNILLLLLI